MKILIAGQGAVEDTITFSWYECELVQPLWKARKIKFLKMLLPFKIVILLLEIIQNADKDLGTEILISASEKGSNTKEELSKF